MDAMLLSKMVVELFQDQDVISLPGFGKFEAKICPASFSDRGYTINPPYRTITFSQERGSDNSLSEFYARENGIKIEESRAIIEAFFRDLEKSLERDREYTIEALGKFKLMAGGSILFVCNPDLNVFPDGFGLEPVSLRNAKAGFNIDFAPDQEIIVEPALPGKREKRREEKRARRPQKPKRPLRKWTWIVWAVAIVMIALRLMGMFCPEVVDHVLYNSADYELIHGN